MLGSVANSRSMPVIQLQGVCKISLRSLAAQVQALSSLLCKSRHGTLVRLIGKTLKYTVMASPNLRSSTVKTAILSQYVAPTSMKPETKVIYFFQSCHLAPFDSLPTYEANRWSAGATPIAHFLGAIVSGSQAALMSSAKDLKLQVGHVKWHATGKYDLRGVRGEEVRSQLQAMCMYIKTISYVLKAAEQLYQSALLCQLL